VPGDRETGETRSLRLFVAFDVSSQAADAIDRAIEPWRAAFPAARWVPRENWHVTLKFLGQTWPRLEAWVGERVGETAASCAPVQTRLRGLGRFPAGGRARVLWAGLDDGAGLLGRIALALDAALAPEFRVETRAFSPHLTVARSDPALDLPEAFVETPVEPVGTRIGSVTLFRSHLRRPAPRYEALATYRLGG